MAKFEMVPGVDKGTYDIVRTIRSEGTSIMQWFTITEAELDSRVENGG